MISGIYFIHNIITDKIYIGSTNNFKTRWSKHKRLLNAGTHHSKHLQNSWNKYGSTAFIFFEFEYTTNLIVREQVWLDFFKSYNVDNGYNICPTAGNSKGFKHSEETKARIKASVVNTNYKHSGCTRALMSMKMSIIKSKTDVPNYILVPNYKRANPTLSNREIGRRLNISATSICKILKKYG